MPLFRLLAAPRSTRSVKIHAIPITTIFQRNCCYILVRSVHTRRQVAATYMSRRHVAATVNRSVCMQQMLPQQVAQIQSDLIFCDLLQRQNSVSETKIFTKILQYTRSYLSRRRVASVATTCCCNLSPSVHVYRPTAAFWTNFCITIVSNLSWVLLTVVPREIEDNKYATFCAVNRSCIMVYVKIVN